ncbi:JmjC domain-containing histone demethylation protein 1 [Coemansia guatemalensis]|uniref:JmjC domain-containing histone demethylation protein 1 n=1 Tax=Coemansia guatemalensis TaxID=2761395 RepID=A0A9W8LVX4_9FUNG|nr:JmjC domain-containing histone demethylation protein 1 [Coemansia guatemalensis]
MSDSLSDDPQECPLCVEDAPVDLPAYETWLQCDVCEEWYHGVCVGISASESKRIDKFHCKGCVGKHGPSSYSGPAPRRSGRQHSHVDYNMLNEGQPATFNQYMLRLEAHEFAEDEFDHLEDGHRVTAEWLRNRDSNDPFVVEDSQGLGLTMPGSSTTISEVVELIGRDTAVSVMDVLTQEELKGWTLGDWAAYFEASDRKRVLNVISLEVSGTALDERVRRPRVVDEVDLVERYWPVAKRKADRYPRVKTYCLMGVQNAYTDFHVDFSATWVYYHIVWGAKVFYLVPPTASNMRKFESWSRSPEQAVSLFAENVRQCFEVRVEAGNTLFIPAGWIHAVLTPVDTLAIGGNFLVMQSLNTHIGVYKLEARTGVPQRYRFPFFLKLCRYLAELLARKWSKEDARARGRWTMAELEGVFVLAVFLAGLLAENHSDNATSKALGDRAALQAHVDRLLELASTELSLRMTSAEWVNREQQLREGCHFRWIRPGMPQGSLLLAARPRRSRAAGDNTVTDKAIGRIRRKTAERTAPQGLTRLVRGRPKTNGELSAVLGTGAAASDNGSSSSDGSDEDDDDGETDDDENSSDASDTSSGSERFVVSDSEDGRGLLSRKRRSISTGSRPKNARQRIAERLKIKL